MINQHLHGEQVLTGTANKTESLCHNMSSQGLRLESVINMQFKNNQQKSFQRALAEVPHTQTLQTSQKQCPEPHLQPPAPATAQPSATK